MRTPDSAPRAWWPLALFLGAGAAAGTTAPRLLPSAGPAEARQPAALEEDSHAAPPPADGSTKLRPVLHLIGESLGVGRDTQGAEADESLQRRLQEKAQNAGVTVDFLIAGIADYVDSNVGWYADLQLEAIQAAMVATEYTLDRSYLPDWPRGGREAHTHRESPGAVVFRGRTPGGPGKLRVVLLVPETPTAGLHREALRNALTLVRTWDANPASELRILGPNFSGSVDSLSRVLREDEEIWNRRRVRIISGSAATATNRTVLETGAEVIEGRRMVAFSATTHPFPVWLRSLKRYLGSIDPAWAEGHGLAVLHESNTTFGSSSVRNAIFPHWTPIAFPLHISRLREAAAATAAVRPGQTRALIPLSSREASTPTDQLPLLAPDLTGASVEATMASVFDALRRERFRVVAIIATDERDTLYLAREVRRISPDTQLVLFGSYMLTFHPEYASYTRGAIVVSSYPLAAAVAHWGVSASKSTRRHFPTWFAQGIYNAAVALVGSHDLVDYAVRWPA